MKATILHKLRRASLTMDERQRLQRRNIERINEMNWKISPIVTVLLVIFAILKLFFVMDLETFIETVRSMRERQKAYFTKGRKQSDLIESKRLEKLVDDALDGNLIIPILDTRPDDSEPGVQAGLFE